MKRFIVGPLIGLGLLFTANAASAFCRTTTCTCTASQEVTGTANPCSAVCPTDEHGCKTTGTPVAWTGSCVGFSLDVRGTANLSVDQWTDALTRSFLAWGAVDCGGGKHPSIDVRQLNDVTCGKNEYDATGPNANAVFFQDDGWTGRDVDHLLALTTVHFDHTTGEIRDADMAVNSAAHDFSVTGGSSDYDLVSVVTHEVGHFLGLDHCDNPDAVMYFQEGTGEVKRDLSADDIAGICAIYPPDRVAACDPTPKNGLKTSCADGSAAGCSVSATDTRDPSGLVTTLFAGFMTVLATTMLRRRRR